MTATPEQPGAAPVARDGTRPAEAGPDREAGLYREAGPYREAGGHRPPPPPPPPPPPLLSERPAVGRGPEDAAARPPVPPLPAPADVALIERLLPAPAAPTIDLRSTRPSLSIPPPPSSIEPPPIAPDARPAGRLVIDLGEVAGVTPAPSLPAAATPSAAPPPAAGQDGSGAPPEPVDAGRWPTAADGRAALARVVIAALVSATPEDRRQIAEATEALSSGDVDRLAASGSPPDTVAGAVIDALLGPEPAQAAALAEVVLRDHSERFGGTDPRVVAAADRLVVAHRHLDRRVLADMAARHQVMVHTVQRAVGADHPVTVAAARAADRLRADEARRRVLGPRPS